ncbi:hypothetical protein QV13_08445 [Mesorhizobium hungaricum]|jgi:hypothetical protein|uniref:Lipoprotein n=1 Tax=Mesorhizobium hungaricum TaxID=1566387 RepID=A0A1C2E107_9HYPH|nr:hypothetical protein [Mesorhizobium sp.]OCX20692.1 hypothetical protein QV13_08445 [Mesorhizobium hungaricum]
MTSLPLTRRSLHAIGLALIIAPVLGMALPAAAQEKAVAPEINPPGDIPDNQQFITFEAAQGVAMKVPEGWARTDTKDGATFADKYGRIELSIQQSASAITVDTLRAQQVADLERNGRAVKVLKIEQVKLPAGPAVKVVFTSNSNPNPVTNKQIRLESERFYMQRNGKLAELTFSAPAGADNVDQWVLMSKSFRWK